MSKLGRYKRTQTGDFIKLGAIFLASSGLLVGSVAGFMNARKTESKWMAVKDEAVKEYMTTEEYIEAVNNEKENIFTDLNNGEITSAEFKENYDNLNSKNTAIKLMKESSNDQIIQKYEEAVENSDDAFVLSLASAGGMAIGGLFALGSATCATAYAYIISDLKKDTKPKKGWQNESVKNFMDYVHGAKEPQKATFKLEDDESEQKPTFEKEDM